MFSLVRKVVAGPKNTTSYEGSELDLTYITDRVIAMAFPASDLLEKTYRNPIERVAHYLNEAHPNRYLIINVSSRNYDYASFKFRVKDYPWPDHQTPTLSTLVQAAYDMLVHLRADSGNVVAVHCNHGKGRTGTAIIALFLLAGLLPSARDCLAFYNSKRFTNASYGVDQPCQLRYLSFLELTLRTPKPAQSLVCYRLKGVTQHGLAPEDYYLSIRNTRTQQALHQHVCFSKQVREGAMIMGDIFLELFCEKWVGTKRIARLNYHLHFLEGGTKLKIRGQDIKVTSGHSKDFEIKLYFEYYCLCHLQAYNQSSCRCRLSRLAEQTHWQLALQQIAQCRSNTNKSALALLYYPREEHELREEEKGEKDHSWSHRSFEGQPRLNKRQARLHKYFSTIKNSLLTPEEEFPQELPTQFSEQGTGLWRDHQAINESVQEEPGMREGQGMQGGQEPGALREEQGHPPGSQVCPSPFKLEYDDQER